MGVQLTSEKFFLGHFNTLFVLVLPPRWSRKGWSEYVDRLVELRARGPEPSAMLTFSDGQMASAADRKELAERMPPVKGFRARQAVLSSNLLMRGIITALHWLRGVSDYEMRAFAPHRYLDALDWLEGSSAIDRKEAIAALRTGVVEAGYNPSVLTERAPLDSMHP